ncbi:MAG: cellulase family glycosylhydrolase, partial [Bacteroidaceae bacterium]|nr:cellulase family glycosylhydrolase [Bacteroidaceae bacterium]
MKKTLFLLLSALLMVAGTSHAHDLEPLHVDGRYLKNPKGDIVTLHGFLQTYAANEDPGYIRWDEQDVEACLNYKMQAVDSMIAAGWKMDYVRLMLATDWWINRYFADSTPHFELFRKYFEELCLPMIDFFHSRGIYTVLWGVENSNFPTKLEQQRLLLWWDYVSSHPRIRNNPGVMFELHNEPDYFDDAVYEDFGKAWTDWMQPVVDKIRSHCDNVIFVPSVPQAQRGFVDFPLKGGNIGYQNHYYPGWDLGYGIENSWDASRLPLSNLAPLIITETAWYGDREGSGGDISNGTTTDFGKPLKDVMDKYGNVSWNSYMPNEIYYIWVNRLSEDGTLDWWNDPESCFVPLFDWYKEYAKTKVLPVSQLKAKTVTLGDVPANMQPGDTYSLKMMAEFTNGMTWNVAGDAAYTVSDPGVLTVAHGNIRVLKEGTVTVDVKYTDGTGQTFDRQFQVVSAGELPTIRVFADNKAVWYGDELPALTYTTLNTNLTGTPQLATAASSTSPAGDYPITISQGTISDPNVKYIEGELRILPAPLDATLQDATINEGDTPELTFTYSGFRNGDTQGNTLKKEPAIFVSREGHTFDTRKLNSHLPAGSYFIMGRGGEAQNYELCHNVAKLTVEKTAIEGVDLTARVKTEDWEWHSGTTDDWDPAVTTSDGRSVRLIERYEETTESTGELMWQEVTGLPNGDYVVEVWANACYTPGRGFGSSVTEGADDVAYVEANGQRTYLDVRFDTRLPWSEFYSINATVTDGKLRIALVAEKPGTNWHTIQIKRLILKKNVNELNDLTVLVGTSQEAWKAGGMVGWAAPEVTTRDGRTTALAEMYEETTETTGTVMEQTVMGLPNGRYSVTLYANACYTPNRGFDSGITDGQTDVVYLFANSTRKWIPARIAESVEQNGEYTLTCTVTDGTLHLGMVAEKAGTNWHSMQIRSLDRLDDTTVTADNKTMIYGDEVPELTYTIDGFALDGTPHMTTTATSTSPVGTYPITVERGTVTNERVDYVAGTLTITKAPLAVGVKDATITEGDALPTFTLTYDGFRNKDTEATAFTTKPRATTTATAASTPGEYPITVSGGKAANYELSYTGGTLTIEANPLPQDEDLTARVGTS